MHLAPNSGICWVAERRQIDICDELPACARQDYDLVSSMWM